MGLIEIRGGRFEVRDVREGFDPMTQSDIDQRFARCQEREIRWFNTGKTVELNIGALVEVPGLNGLWRVSKVVSNGRIILTQQPISFAGEP